MRRTRRIRVRVFGWTDAPCPSHTDAMPEIRITVDGKLALTTGQLAEEFGIGESGMRDALRRDGIEPVAMLLGRPLYAAVSTRRELRARPGRGNRRRPTTG